ncbi:MAG: hypothetical protein JO037_25690 [Actinobacteria bacterium]|nr:hypothetical protein [Actinomycetota bacterium]
MNVLRACAAGILAVLPLAGCAGHQQETGRVSGYPRETGQVSGYPQGTGQATGHQPETGQVTGQLTSVGGKPPGKRPMAGTVTFTVLGRELMAVQTEASGHFSAQLPPGRYQVSGPCSQSFPVTVSAQQTAHVNIYCIIRVAAPPSD